MVRHVTNEVAFGCCITQVRWSFRCVYEWLDKPIYMHKLPNGSNTCLFHVHCVIVHHPTAYHAKFGPNGRYFTIINPKQCKTSTSIHNINIQYQPTEGMKMIILCNWLLKSDWKSDKTLKVEKVHCILFFHKLIRFFEK